MYQLQPDSVTVLLRILFECNGQFTTLCYGAFTNFGFIAQAFFNH